MLSYSYMTSKHWLCERCLKKGIFSPGRICHHKTWLNPENINDVDVSLNPDNPDNLECLCMDCHNKEHSVIKMFDSEGQIVRNNSKAQAELMENEKDLDRLLEKLGE